MGDGGGVRVEGISFSPLGTPSWGWIESGLSSWGGGAVAAGIMPLQQSRFHHSQWGTMVSVSVLRAMRIDDFGQLRFPFLRT